MGVHGHSRTQPSAIATCEIIRDLHGSDEYCTWVYVPLPRHDAIIGCGPPVNQDLLTGAEISHRWVHFLVRLSSYLPPIVLPPHEPAN
jgi:hypothetical protein